MDAKKGLCYFLAACAWMVPAELAKASEPVVKLEPSSLSGTSDGATIQAWTNTGSLGGNFVPAVAGQGAVYRTNSGGVTAVTFAASASSVMTNTVLPPAALLGAGTVWSAEIWVLNPTLQGTEDQLAWTDRSNWAVSGDGACMELRYCADAANAVEHFNSTCNIPWNGNPPQAGVWHHVAITRSADGSERLYADGALRTTRTPAVSNLRGGAPFALGGVWDRAAANWQMLFSGSLAVVRVYTNTLSGEEVLANYLSEQATYQAVWSGTPGAAGAWANSGNWLGGNVAGSGETAWITNGGLAELSADLSLAHLYPDYGGLTVTNGAKLTLGALDSVYLANNGKSFALTVADGALKLPGSGTVNLYMGNAGGDATAVVGVSGAPALLDVDRDTIVANSAGSVGAMTVGAGGSVYNSNGWFYLANNIGAQGQMTVNGGTVGFRLPDKNFVVNVNGARGEVTVNSGRISATGDFKWSNGTATNTAYGAVYLSGGTLEGKRFFADSTAGTNLLYLNGGTVKARVSASDFLFNLTTAYLQSKGVTFDIPSNVTVTAAQGLVEDPASTGGGLTKQGAGRLTFSGANTLSGNIDVLAGDLFFSNAGGLPADYAGTVTLTNDAASAIGFDKDGGATQLLARMDTNSVGFLTLFPSNRADTVAFTNFPYLKLAFSGGFDFTGTFLPYAGAYLFKVEGATITNSSVLADGTVPGHLTVIGVSGGGMVLNGNNAFTGGAEIDAATVTLGHANALGFQGTPGVRDIALRNGAVLRFAADMDVNALVTGRLTTASSGILLIGAANAAKSIDLSNHPGIVVGSAELSLDYAGTLTPATALNAFRLGGGNAAYTFSSYRGFSVSNLADGAEAHRAVVGTPGIVELKAGNTYSGGTVVTNRGVLFIKEDGLGKVPDAPDAANLTVDNGVIRSGNANFALHANRGVTVGAGGLELHPWGGYTMTVQGNLSGSGRITTSDGGYVTFGGSGNTYNGNVTINSGHNIRVGTGPAFSWSSTGGITDNGTLYLKTDAEKSFGDTVSGGGSVRKEGSGALTLSAAQSYSGTTFIDAGKLRVSGTEVLPRGAGKGVVEIASGAALETDGRNLVVGGLKGIGLVTNQTGSAGTLYVGATNVNASFSGALDLALGLAKINTGTQTLANAAPIGLAEVQAGTLECFGAVTVTGKVTVSGGTLGVTYGTRGLIGKYYTLAAEPLPADFVSYAAVTNFLAGKTPSVVSNSIGFGSTFNALANGSRFPAPYSTQTQSNFAVLWTGLFFAETAGSYGFATASDDGSVLFIDGEMVVDNNAKQGYTAGDRYLVSPKALTKGVHEIAIAFYEAGGDQGLTVWVTRPGAASDEELPNSLLFTGLDEGETQVGALSGNAGGVAFGAFGPATLRIVGDSDMTFGGTITGSNGSSRLVKEGDGALVLTSNNSDHWGTLDVLSGSVVLTNAAATLGTLSLASGTAASVYGQSGLQMYFYNRSAADSDYSEFQSMAAWEAYLGSTFPGGPSYVASSLVLGSTLDTGTAGEYWPDLYKQTGGAEAETYDAYLFGSIFLSQSGTYTFATASDDGSMLFIDRALVVNNGYNQGVTQRSGTIALAAGFHSIAIPYRENTGGNALRVYIGYPGQSLVMMPQSILFSSAVLRGVAGEAGSAFDLLQGAVVTLQQSADTTFAGAVSGNAGSLIQKSGAGTLTLTGDNTNFAGTYAISAGAVRVGAGGLTGSLGPTASASVLAGAKLIFDRAGTVTVGGSLSGSGVIQLDGPGEVYVTSTNSFSGTVVINSGRLTFGPGAALGAAAVITNTATVEVETSGTSFGAQVLGDLVGGGDLEVSGTGTLVLNDDTSFTGAARVLAGAKLQVSTPANLGGGGDVALEGGTLEVKPDVEPGTNQLVAALSAGAWTTNSAAVLVSRSGSTWVRLTPNSGSTAGSAFCNTKVSPHVPWYASFRYEVGAHPVSAADGVTFLLQNDGRGATALGASGGALGASGITPSIGVFINIYQAPTVGWIVDGARVDAVSALNGINPTNGVDVAVSYDGADLRLTLEQDGKVYTATRTVNLLTKFGGNTTYVGFTGATGGATAEQFVGAFAMADAVPTSTDFGNAVTVADGQSGNLTTVLVNDDTVFSFEGFELGSNAVLSVAAGAGSKTDADYAVGASNVTVAAGVATVNVAANGTGVGVLALNTLTFGSGAKLVVTGAVSVPGGVLTVVVPTPVPSGVTYLADFTGATWVGGVPNIVLVDAWGNPVDAPVFLRAGKLYINTVLGTLLRVK